MHWCSPKRHVARWCQGDDRIRPHPGLSPCSSSLSSLIEVMGVMEPFWGSILNSFELKTIYICSLLVALL